MNCLSTPDNDEAKYGKMMVVVFCFPSRNRERKKFKCELHNIVAAGVVIEASCIKPSWLNVLLSTKYHAACYLLSFGRLQLGQRMCLLVN